MTVRIRRYERNSRMETNVEAKSWALTSAYLKMRAFWDIAPCNLVGVDRRFRGAYCLHHHPDGGSPHFSNVSTSTRLLYAVSQKALIFTLATVKT
jgi:hypothetical protein